MSVFTLIIFISAVLSILASADPYVLNGGIGADLERRQAVTSTTTSSPTLVPTGHIVVPLVHPTTTSASTSTQGGQVGVPINRAATASTTTSAGGIVGTPASQSSTTSPVGIVGTPATHSSSNFFKQHSINSNLPNYAVLIIIILSGILFFALGAVAVLRYQKYRQVKTENRRKLEDEEDVFDKYNKHWKSKRESGRSSPVDDEKEG